MPMTAKERVRTAMRGGIPDRVPMNYLCNPGIDGRLKAHFGLAGDDDEGLRLALGIDFRDVNAPYTGPRLHPERPGREVDPCYGMITRWVPNEFGGYWEFCDFPLADVDWETVRRWPMPNPDHYDYDAARAWARTHAEFGLFIGSPGFGDILNTAGHFMGMENVYMALADDNPALWALTDRRFEITLEIARRTLEAAGGLVDFVWMGEDLGTQIAPLISVGAYRRHLRPRHERVLALARSFDLPVMVHTCGASSWVYEDFIDMGVACVDTLQPEAAGMAPASLKERFGGRLAFHGAISTGGVVARGTAGDTRREVREVLDILMPGGGYLLAPTHQWQDNSPTENVLAVYETGARHGGYH